MYYYYLLLKVSVSALPWYLMVVTYMYTVISCALSMCATVNRLNLTTSVEYTTLAKYTCIVVYTCIGLCQTSASDISIHYYIQS